MKYIFQKIGSRLVEAFFPERCVFCGKISYSTELNHSVCPECAGKIFYLPKPDISGFASGFKDAPGKIYCVCRYTGIIKKAIISFKYSGKAYYAKALSWILYSGVAGHIDFSRYDFICAVPSSREKLRDRGFNQAELLARGLSENCSVPYRKNVLVKSRDLPSQSLLDMEQRLRSVKGIFQVGDSHDFSRENSVEGKKIIIVDDVLTTGATIIECARMLWSKGAGEVAAVILATGKRNV